MVFSQQRVLAPVLRRNKTQPQPRRRKTSQPQSRERKSNSEIHSHTAFPESLRLSLQKVESWAVLKRNPHAAQSARFSFASSNHCSRSKGETGLSNQISGGRPNAPSTAESSLTLLDLSTLSARRAVKMATMA